MSIKTIYGRYIDIFPILFAFVGGFVFFEPSLAEIAFVAAIPGLVLRAGRDRRALILASLLFLPLVFSLAYGRVALGSWNLRFAAIDAYLFLFFAVSVGTWAGDAGGRTLLIKNMLRAMAAASFIGIAVGCVFYALGTNPPGMRIVFENRLYGFFKDTNVFASYMLIPFIYFAQAFFESERLKAIAANGLTCVVLSFGILLTFSRAAWIVYALGLLFLWGRAMVRGPSRSRIVAAAFALVLAASLSIIAFGNVKIGGFDIGAFASSRLGMMDYDTDRFEAQGKAFDMFASSPLFGIGPGVYETRSSLSAHNLYLRYLGERGLVGMAAAIAFLVLLVFPLRKRRIETWLAICALGILIESCFIDTLHWRHLWIIAAMIAFRPNVDDAAG